MRPTWDEWGLALAETVATRADCRRRLAGAVILDEVHRVIGTGYNGVRAGLPGCLEGACPRGLLTYDQIPPLSNYDDPNDPGYCISVHAEANAIIHAGRDVVGCTIYISSGPCGGCQKLISGAGLSRAVFRNPDGSIGELTWT